MGETFAINKVEGFPSSSSICQLTADAADFPHVIRIPTLPSVAVRAALTVLCKFKIYFTDLSHTTYPHPPRCNSAWLS
jgi:hypothetical protein